LNQSPAFAPKQGGRLVLESGQTIRRALELAGAGVIHTKSL